MLKDEIVSSTSGVNITEAKLYPISFIKTTKVHVCELTYCTYTTNLSFYLGY